MNTKENLFFLRHGKLLLPYKDHGEMPFRVLAELGTGEKNPPLDELFAQERIAKLRDQMPLSSVTKIFASPWQRCQHAAHLLAEEIRRLGGSVEIETEPLVEEVDFDLIAMNADGHVEKGLHEKGIGPVNTAVFEAMVSGVNGEPVEITYERIRTFFTEKAPESEHAIVITHDFIMRVIEMYIRRRGIAYSPISVSDLEQTQRNLYLSGFATNHSAGTFRSISSY